MVGWKRVVVTVGERIGKDHLTYAQGASAGLVAMGTIFAADKFGLPVSTTHILSSGVAGTMCCKRKRPPLLDGAQHRRRLGLHAARRGTAFRRSLLGVPHIVVNSDSGRLITAALRCIRFRFRRLS